jgi:hypothetical protein
MSAQDDIATRCETEQASPSKPYLDAVIETIRTLRPEDLLLIDRLARRLKEIDNAFEDGKLP